MKYDKVFVAATAVVLSFAAFSEQYSLMSKKEISKADKDKWGGAEELAPKIIDGSSEARAKIREVTAAIDDCRKNQALLKEWESERVRKLIAVLSTKISAPGVASGSDGSTAWGRNAQRSNAIIAAYKKYDATLGKELRKTLQDAVATKMISRYTKWSCAQGWLERNKMAERLGRVEKGCFDFLCMVDTCQRNSTCNEVSGTELWGATRLEKRYWNDDGRPSSFLDNGARAVDRYLDVMNLAEHDEFKKAIEKLEADNAAMYEASGEFDMYWEDHAMDLHPEDRELIRKLFLQSLEVSIEDVTKLIKGSQEMLKKSDDMSTDIGQLRFMGGKINKYNTYSVYGGGDAYNGVPGYQQRIRKVFAECKSRYMKVLEESNRKHPERQLYDCWK